MTSTTSGTREPTARYQMDDAVRAWRRAGHRPGVVTVIDPAGVPDLVRRALANVGVDLDEQHDVTEALMHCAHVLPQAVILSARAVLDESALVVTVLRERYRLPVLLALGDGDVERATAAIVAGALPVLDLPLRPAAVLRQLDRVWVERVDRPTDGQTDPQSRQLAQMIGRLDLTGTEIAVLSRLAAGHGRTVRRDDLRRLWPVARDPDGTMVAAIIRLRRKLAEVGYVDAIVTVRRLGYRLELATTGDVADAGSGSRALVSA